MKRTETIIIRLTKEEKANIERKAKEQGLSLSSYLRSLGMKDK